MPWVVTAGLQYKDERVLETWEKKPSVPELMECLNIPQAECVCLSQAGILLMDTTKYRLYRVGAKL